MPRQQSPRPTHGWALADYTGNIMVWSTRYSRRDAVKDFVEEYRDSWDSLRRKGWRVVKVRIVPVEPKGGVS